MPATATSVPAEKLDRVNVLGERYQPGPLDLPSGWGRLLGFQPDPPPDFLRYLGQFVVTATRMPQDPQRVSASTRVFDSDVVRSSPTTTLDSALRSLPSFSLFRRSDSLTANPTTQGVSLRGLGPSGASRSLVLLDGVPLNDPFGGWITWSQVPRRAIDRIEIVPGGGSAAWGNAALGGVLQLFLQLPRTEMIVVDRPPAPLRWGSRGTAQLDVAAGDFGTRIASIILDLPAGTKGVAQIMGEDFATNGFNTVAPSRRGPIDTNAWSRHRSLSVRLRESLGAKAEISATVRDFEEARGNGTPYQRNSTRVKFASLQAVAQPTEFFAWNAVAYAQEQSYASTFSALDAVRASETPANDQYAVPATAAGVGWTGTFAPPSGSSTGFGADVRTVHGETRENYSYSAGTFTRERVAGGTQTFAGLFAVHQRRIAPDLRATVGIRLDDWRDENGHRRERNRLTGDLTRLDAYPTQQGAAVSPNAGIVWTPSRAWRWRGSGQQAFRRPTLNELYRPFRQGANVTEANPSLRTEHVTSAEFGGEWTLWKPGEAVPGQNRGAKSPAPDRALLKFGATVFWNDLHDAVANVTLARGPGTFPLFGSLPAGGIGRQRLNLDRLEVKGAELTATWSPLTALSVEAALLDNESEVRRAAIAPALVGKRLAEVPRRTATVGATWHAPWQLTLTPRVRWIGRQFDDDENTLRLGEVVVADLGVTRPLNRHVELYLSAENVGNARVETARSADGVVNIGTPRLVLAGVRGKW